MRSFALVAGSDGGTAGIEPVAVGPLVGLGEWSAIGPLVRLLAWPLDEDALINTLATTERVTTSHFTGTSRGCPMATPGTGRDGRSCSSLGEAADGSTASFRVEPMSLPLFGRLPP